MIARRATGASGEFPRLDGDLIRSCCLDQSAHLRCEDGRKRLNRCIVFGAVRELERKHGDAAGWREDRKSHPAIRPVAAAHDARSAVLKRGRGRIVIVPLHERQLRDDVRRIAVNERGTERRDLRIPGPENDAVGAEEPADGREEWARIDIPMRLRELCAEGGALDPVGLSRRNISYGARRVMDRLIRLIRCRHRDLF